jgi:hypothetical protein
MDYKKLNVVGGLITFAIATAVYFLTLEQTVSLWDCGEYITAAYKLEVGHPPGAPLFMLLGRLFSFFAAPENVAMMINIMSALSSSFSILFMYWSISMLAKKMAFKDTNRQLSNGQIIAIQGSAFIGSLVYTFSDSFWFSAVEGEVYAMSSLFTAVIFWAILKWDEESDAVKFGELTTHKSASRWLILIMFLFGLAIGVHLLGLLVIPAIAYVIYFNKWEKFDWMKFFITGIIGIVALAFIQEGIIPGTIAMASKMEIFFRNSLGLPFNSGTIAFFGLVMALLVYGLFFTHKRNMPIANTVILSLVVLFIGYGSFATIVIRSNANPPLDENDPENLVTLHAYLKREQYGSWPILYGENWNSQVKDLGDKSPVYQRKFVVTKNGNEIKGFKSEKLAKEFAAQENGEVIEKYFVVNDGKKQNYVYHSEHMTFLPRMYFGQDERKVEAYKSWSGYTANGPNHAAKPSIPTTDGQRLPTFGENMRYMFSYQINWMYFRYFMWNFAGRQNDIQGHGDVMRGNWKSGLDLIDEQRLGDQRNAPLYTRNNPSNNSFYYLPLILGLIGMAFHFFKAPKDAFVVLLLFLFTGLAIVVYLNQKPFEPRERDYAYAASFYAFAIWIGLAVYALFDVYKSMSMEHLKKAGYGVLAVLGVFVVRDLSAGDFAASLSWIFIAGLAALMGLVMFGLRGKLKQDAHAAYLAITLTFAAPALMALDGWDDHDRGNRSTALDLAKNYMNSCEDNSIIFTNGDNDTFPLWYYQEVEGQKTSVRVCNLSLLQTDWYTEQMTMKMYDSEPLPILFREDQYANYTGKTDGVYFLNTYLDMISSYPKETVEKLFARKIEVNQGIFNSSYRNAAYTLGSLLSRTQIASKNPEIMNYLAEPKEKPGLAEFNQFMKISIGLLRNGVNESVGLSREVLEQVQKNMENLETSIDYLPIKEIMEFVRDDKNMIEKETRGGFEKLRIFPSSGFIMPLPDTKTLVANKIISKEEAKDVPSDVRFRVTKTAVQKEQVIMLDILANLDWSRNVYFSSPYASEIGKALFQAGHVDLEGMVYKLTPVKGRQVNLDKLYDNMMSTYVWGNMNHPKVLVDYYTRRHTTQYRHYFFILAEQNAREFENQNKMIESLKARKNEENADQGAIDEQIRLATNKSKKAKETVVEVIRYAMDVMPLSKVIDYGEPNSGKQPLPEGSGLEFVYTYDDGKVHEYVKLLYIVGAKEEAEKLGLEVADELESIMDFTLYERPAIASGTETDFFAALDAYLNCYTVAREMADDQLTARMNRYMAVMQKQFKGLLKAMKEEDAGKDRESRRFSGTIASFEERMYLMGLVHGLEL